MHSICYTACMESTIDLINKGNYTLRKLNQINILLGRTVAGKALSSRKSTRLLQATTLMVSLGTLPPNVADFYNTMPVSTQYFGRSKLACEYSARKPIPIFQATKRGKLQKT